jgi:hypothetical protein
LPFSKTNHSSPPKEGHRNKYSQYSNQKLCPKKRKPLMIQIHPFKKKEKEGGEGRFSSVANGRF